uniref:ribose-5-phosphate isomerase n=1 Tax=Heterorhabditis bacteriophora TaxID=37862 RepID=A0A1I7X049_HETBA
MAKKRIDENFTCIKGGGGCLAREKIVQNAAKKFFVRFLHFFSVV